MDKQDPTKTSKKSNNKYDNSVPLDVHKWSDYPEVKEATDFIFLEAKRNGLIDKETNVAKFKIHLRVTLINLYACYISSKDGYLGYARTPNSYIPSKRYNKLHIKFTPLMKVVECLEALGYVENKIGFHDRRTGIGRQSRLKAKNKLIKLIVTKYGFSPIMVENHHDEEVIILRDENKSPIDYRDEDYPQKPIKKWRETVEQYNQLIAKTYIDIDYDFPKGALKNPVNLSNKFVRRIFNNGSFDDGGRFYGGWWQNVPSNYRKHIVINGEPIVECDYSGLHIELLYIYTGMYPDELLGDVYDIGVENSNNDPKVRRLIKDVFLCALNANSKSKAVKAVQKNINDSKDEYPAKYPKLNGIYDAILKKHPKIKEYLGSGIGIKLQNIDSEMAASIISPLRKIPIPILCIHDGFIASYSNLSLLVERMTVAFRFFASQLMGLAPSDDKEHHARFMRVSRCNPKIKIHITLPSKDTKDYYNEVINITGVDRTVSDMKFRSLDNLQIEENGIRKYTPKQARREGYWKDTNDCNFFIQLR